VREFTRRGRCAEHAAKAPASLLACNMRRFEPGKFWAPDFGIVESNTGMPEEPHRTPDSRLFEAAVLPHLNAAYNLARWLVRNPHDAEDLVQEAYLRAFKFWGGYQGGDARAWLLKIVRNTCYTFLEKSRSAKWKEEFDEVRHASESPQADPEASLLASAESALVRDTLERLPVNFREALILRELEGLSYREIADVMQVPIGTVMSSLARGRARLRELLLQARAPEARNGVR
jgi:RNA polymerase sigma-70 factor, ECF subfamily